MSTWHTAGRGEPSWPPSKPAVNEPAPNWKLCKHNQHSSKPDLTHPAKRLSLLAQAQHNANDGYGASGLAPHRMWPAEDEQMKLLSAHEIPYRYVFSWGIPLQHKGLLVSLYKNSQNALTANQQDPRSASRWRERGSPGERFRDSMRKKAPGRSQAPGKRQAPEMPKVGRAGQSTARLYKLIKNTSPLASQLLSGPGQ